LQSEKAEHKKSLKSLQDEIENLTKANKKLEKKLKDSQEILTKEDTKSETPREKQEDTSDVKLDSKKNEKSNKSNVEESVESSSVEQSVKQEKTQEEEESSSEKESPLKDKTLVILGTLSKLNRSQAKTLITEAGGRVVSSPSSKVDYVVVAKNPGEKLKKAQRLNISQLSEKQFLDYLNSKS
jgi:epidermal growth factor receptor substrate 15